ncbi:MAG: patatin-like phospholipase family protein [Archangium sp.]
MRRFWIVWACLSSGCVVADLTNRSVFANLTYGEQPPDPPPQLTFQLYATLQSDVGGPWNEPAAAATCLRSITGADLETLGHATTGTRNSLAWATALWPALAPLRARPECTASFAADHLQLAWSLGKAGDTLYSYAALTWLEAAEQRPTFDAGADALHRLAGVVAATPANQKPQNDLPVLALSGGAANGAFTAGFLYELLAVRGLALERLDEPQRAAFDRSSRFSSVVGTSVGALQAQLLDLAMIDDSALTPAQQQFLDACRGLPMSTPAPHGDLSGGNAACFAGFPSVPFPATPTLPSHPAQSCALKLLQHFFADVDETALMCAEPGSVLRSVGVLGKARTNFIRFDPMQRDPIDPVLGLFHDRMHDDALVRVAMSTETTQNQLIAFDERACTGDDDVACLSSGVMASLVLPVFARSVTHTWSGYERAGECGVYVDGGLRSQLPALRALMRSRATPLLRAPTLRVLALDTGRLTPLPSPVPKIFLAPILGSLEQYATQQDLTELSFAQHLAELRDDEFEALAFQKAPPGTPPPQRLPGASDARVDGVYVPSDVPDWVVVGAGYSFDRYVMRGLFVWGQQVARKKLAAAMPSQLGWSPVLVERVRAVVAERAADQDFKTWLEAYSKPVCPAFDAWRMEQGQQRVSKSMEFCVEPEKGPAYFSCPSGAWNPAGAP